MTSLSCILHTLSIAAIHDNHRHHNYSVLLAGEGTDVAKHNVTYLSLYDNKILRSFGGHTDRISGLSMSPVDDSFLSSSAVDRSARLWDIRQSVCVAKVELPITAAGLIHATFDKTGLVFGVASALPGGAGNVSFTSSISLTDLVTDVFKGNHIITSTCNVMKT